jgi:hypothetical protein
MKTKNDLILEILLLSVLIVFPFAYSEFNNRVITIFIPILFLLICSSLLPNSKKLPIATLTVIYSILFLLIFDFAEKTNFSQLFEIPIKFNKRIPLTTIILCVAVFLYRIKNSKEKNKPTSIPPFFKYFLISFIFISILVFSFYPILSEHYDMNFSSNFQLLNNSLKYLMLCSLLLSYIETSNQIKRLNIGLIVSISSAILLNLI